jgi:hypothetical protein
MIANPVYKDHKNVYDHTKNGRTIEKYAWGAKLWPHVEKLCEDQVQHDIKFYMTDRSFTVKTLELRTSSPKN